jgi:hypothetical protein
MKIKRWGVYIMVVSIIAIEADARRIRGYYYGWEKFPLIVYTVRGSQLIPVQYRQEQLPFRAGIFHNSRGIALWVEQKRKHGLLSFRPSVVFLSPYVDFRLDRNCEDEYNWIGYLLDEELISGTWVVFPSRTVKNHPEWVKPHRELVEEANAQGYNLNLLTNLEDLPGGQSLGNVILVIDLAYFADRTLLGSVKVEDVILQISRLGDILKDRGMRIEALLVFSSPQFGLGDSEKEKTILDQLLEVFSIE